MRWGNIAFVTFVLVTILSGSAASQQWVDIRNPEELRALHSNKTFRSTIGGVSFVEHYRADGKAIRIYTADQGPIPYTWEVKGNDQVYYRFKDDQVCPATGEPFTGYYQFQRSKKNPEEYVRRSAKFFFIIKVEDGIPAF